MKAEDCNKTEFIIHNRQYVYLRIGQKLKDAAYTYIQFTNNVFGLLPKVHNVPQMPIFINIYQEDSFSIYMDNHIGAAKIFDTMYTCLYKSYFLRVAFGPVYLLGKKTGAFINILKLFEFEKSHKGLRPSVKHKDKIKQMPVPTS